MSKTYECDFCKKTCKLSYVEKYPQDWYMIKVFYKAQSKGGKSEGYHLCKKCKFKIFGEDKNV